MKPRFLTTKNDYCGLPAEHAVLRQVARNLTPQGQSIGATLRKLHSKYAVSTHAGMAIGFQSHESCHGMILIRLNGMITQENTRWCQTWLQRGEDMAMSHYLFL
jgi:hypothetical protein